MFVDFSENHAWADYDFVIIGAGIAGLFLAQKLQPLGKVLVLEAGSKDPGVGEGYYDIEVTGRRYGALGQRLSCFGGSSNHWGGHSHPLGKEIFENRPGMPGWPISHADYAYHLPEAQAWLNLLPLEAIAKDKTSLETGLLAGQQEIDAVQFQFSNPVTRLGDQPTVDKFAKTEGIDIVLDTRVIDMMLDEGGTRLSSLAIVHQPSKAKRTVPVKTVFLCAGGIENPRLMLWAARKYQTGNPLAGGPNALTGKYFMEHPSISPVDIYFDIRADLSDLIPHSQKGGVGNTVLRPDNGFLEKHGLGRFGLHFQSTPEVAPSKKAIGAANQYYLTRSPGYQRISPFFLFEQTPDQSSFVGLSEKMGSDGTPLARLHWVVTPEDVEKYRKSVILMCGLLNQHGFAKSRLTPGHEGPDWSKIDIGNASHQMGTTRMAHDKAGGVVDADSKVFGLDNFYIAGSSVFPTSDFVNPTMNLMALTARLANFHLAKANDRGANYRFGTGQDENAMLVTGWGKPDYDGVWSVGPTAEITFDPNRATSVQFAGFANGAAAVDVKIDGASVFSGPVKNLFAQKFALNGAGPTTLDLAFSGLVSPKAAGRGDDNRPLGLYLKQLVLK